MIPKEHRANVFFVATGVKHISSVLCVDATLSELRSLFRKVQHSKPAANGEKNCRRDIQKSILPEVELSHSFADMRCSTGFLVLLISRERF